MLISLTFASIGCYRCDLDQHPIRTTVGCSQLHLRENRDGLKTKVVRVIIVSEGAMYLFKADTEVGFESSTLSFNDWTQVRRRCRRMDPTAHLDNSSADQAFHPLQCARGSKLRLNYRVPQLLRLTAPLRILNVILLPW